MSGAANTFASLPMTLRFLCSHGVGNGLVIAMERMRLIPAKRITDWMKVRSCSWCGYLFLHSAVMCTVFFSSCAGEELSAIQLPGQVVTVPQRPFRPYKHGLGFRV